MATKKRSRIHSVKSYGLENDDFEADNGVWRQETKAWMESSTLKGLFTSEDWVFITCDLIAREISSLRRMVYQRVIDEAGQESFEPAPTHPLQKMLDQPNPYQDQVAMRYLEAVEHSLMGNAIIWNAKGRNELYLLQTEQVRIDFQNNGLYNYLYNPNLDEAPMLGTEIKLSPVDILHIRRPNPHSIMWGLSPFVPARKSVLFNRYSTDYLNAFYLKGATPQLALTLDKEASQESVNRMLKSFEMAYTGRRNMRRTMLLPKGVDVRSIGLSVADQQLIDVVKMNRETILAILHVPKHAVGLQETGSLGSEEHSRALKYFWQSTIIPIDKAINAAYTKHFRFQLGENFIIQSDYSDVAILHEDEKVKAELSSRMLTTHTINEVRQLLYGLAPIEGGDVVLELAKLSRQPFQFPQQQATQEQTQALPLAEVKATTESAPEKYSGIDFTPPQSVASYAKRGLAWREEYGRGGTLVGLARARQLSEREVISPDVAKRGYLFFQRHAANMYNTMDNGDPANGKIASYLWGHTAGKRWFDKLWEQMKRADAESGEKTSLEGIEVENEDVAGGTNHVDDFIKSVYEKSGANVSYQRLEREEDKYIKKMNDLSINLFENIFNLSADIIVNRLQGKKEFDTPNAPDTQVDEDTNLARLRRALNDAIQKLGKGYVKDYEKTLEAVVETGYQSQLSLSFMQPARDAIQVLADRDEQERRTILRARGLDSFSQVSKTTTERIMRVVEQGVKNNQSIMEIVRNIADDFKAISPARAETIARTETLTASSIGQAAAMQNASEVIKGLKKVWINAGDTKVRGNPGGEYPDSEFDHWHVQNDGPIDYDEPFSNGLQFPREPGGDAGNVINCFIGSTKVRYNGLIAVFRRKFSGEFFHIKSSSGSELTVTGNHPILTTSGWRAAKDIKLGDKLIRANICIESMNSNDMQKTETTIEQVYSSFSESGMAERVSCRGGYFHGDVSDSDVDIILTKRGLDVTNYSSRSEFSEKFALVSSDILKSSLSSDCSDVKFILSPFSSSDSIMSRHHLSISDFRTHGRPFDCFGLGLGSSLDARIDKDSCNNSSGDLKMFGNSILAPEFNNIQIDDVIDVNSSFDSHYVYNLHTISSQYLAEKIVVHNCRCRLMTIAPGDLDQIRIPKR